jgi:hypothetical protein
MLRGRPGSTLADMATSISLPPLASGLVLSWSAVKQRQSVRPVA